MTRFEELQIKLTESAKKYLDFQNMQVFIEQFTLEKESRLSFSMSGRDYAHFYKSDASFTYDVSQTEMSFYEEELFEADPDYHTTTDLTFSIDFPSLTGYPDIEGLVRDLEEEYPDIEPALDIRKTFSPLKTIHEYGLSYTYEIDIEGELDLAFIDEIFREHRDIMNFIYDRTIDFLDLTWYGEDD